MMGFMTVYRASCRACWMMSSVAETFHRCRWKGLRILKKTCQPTADFGSYSTVYIGRGTAQRNTAEESFED